MLDAFSRSAIIAMSVLCVIGVAALAPLRARSSYNADRHFAARSAPAAPAAVNEIAIRRDPFAGDTARAATGPRAALPTPTALPGSDGSGSAALPASPALPGLPGADMPPLPNNLTLSTIPAVPGDAPAFRRSPRVTAIVTGAHPYAMFDSAGRHEIKGIGDRIDGTSVTAIDISGVTLQGGARLRVSPGNAIPGDASQ